MDGRKTYSVKGREPRLVQTNRKIRRGESLWYTVLLKFKFRTNDHVLDTYIKSRGVLVHLFETPRDCETCKLLKCNCHVHFPDVAEGGHSPRRSGLDVGNINQMASRVSAVPSPQYMIPATPTYPYAVYNPYYQTPQISQVGPAASQLVGMQPVPQSPMYSMSTSGMPVNIGGGGIMTEARGIFIQNLNYSCSPDQLRVLVSSVGRPVDFKLHRTPGTGQFKGTASALFSTKAEAEYAAYYLNQRLFLGMTLSVRLDTETTAVGHVEPLVVNGSSTSVSPSISMV